MNLDSLTRFLLAIGKLLSRIIWIAVIVIVLAAAGRWLITGKSSNDPPVRVQKPLAPPPVDWSAVDGAIAEALQTAAAKASTAAQGRLNGWTATLQDRVDHDFLEWYFSYWNQQVLGLRSIWYWSLGKVFADQPDATERITEKIQEEFAKRVLRPQIAQMELERMTREVLDVYVASLSTEIAAIPGKYRVPKAEWDRYLQDVAVLTEGSEGNRQVSLDLKVLTASGVGGGILLTQKLGPVIRNIGSKLSGRLAGSAAAPVAGRTGTKVAARAGGKFMGPIIGIGIIIWDAWDHQHTKTVERPLLRQNIADYFQEVEQSLLYEPESGILSIVHTIEGNILASLRTGK